jgi:hypothetical protein
MQISHGQCKVVGNQKYMFGCDSFSFFALLWIEKCMQIFVRRVLVYYVLSFLIKHHLTYLYHIFIRRLRLMSPFSNLWHFTQHLWLSLLSYLMPVLQIFSYLSLQLFYCPLPLQIGPFTQTHLQPHWLRSVNVTESPLSELSFLIDHVKGLVSESKQNQCV